MTVYEVNIKPVDQKFNVELGGIVYSMRLMWNEEDDTWILDIGTKEEEPLINGIPLIAGADLLAQYGYLNIGNGGYLYCVTDGQPYEKPTKDNLGSNAHLAWQPYV
jgi:hypothetical protein